MEIIKKKSFKFSFAIGIIWGLLMSFPDGFRPLPGSFTRLIWWTINILLMGLVVGLLGKYMSGYIVKQKQKMDIDGQ